MNKEWDTVELLRHARHDWLNKIQLIKGNLALNNIGRVKEIIDEIVVEAQQESILSNLNIPQFAALLLTYNWEGHSIHLEYDILEDSNRETKSINDELLTDWTAAFLEKLDRSIEVFHENHLSITIERQSTGIGFFFDFRGIITNMEEIKHFLSEKVVFELKLLQVTEQELAFEVYLPY